MQDRAARISKYKMINFDHVISEHNTKWPYIPDHPYRILIIGGPIITNEKQRQNKYIIKVNRK